MPPMDDGILAFAFAFVLRISSWGSSEGLCCDETFERATFVYGFENFNRSVRLKFQFRLVFLLRICEKGLRPGRG